MIKSRIFLGHFSYNSGSVVSIIEKMLPFMASIMIAFALAWVSSSSLDWYFSLKNYESDRIFMLEAKGLEAGLVLPGGTSPAISDFVSANPFNVMEYEKPHAGPAATEQKEEIFSLDGMTLSGTIPGIGAQLRDGDVTPFILSGQEYRGYTLKDVESNRAFFFKNDEEFILLLFYGQNEDSKKSSGKNSSQVKQTLPVRDNPGIAPAEVGQNGTIARELVNDLLMNPFNEMKKVRLRAKFQDGEALGIEVQWLARDSLLGELGVEKGDIVQSINSVPINNMGDISNAINSLMGGDRFEVEVLRKGEKVPLTYTVK